MNFFRALLARLGFKTTIAGWNVRKFETVWIADRGCFRKSADSYAELLEELA